MNRWGLIVLCMLCACRHPDALVVGVMSGPEATLMRKAQALMETRYHLPLKLVVFHDYRQPNEALVAGDLDANLFQHQPYLDWYTKQTGHALVIVDRIFLYPMRGYAHQHHLPAHPVVATPNDPSNRRRADRLLALHGIHPKRILRMDAAMLPRLLDDVDLALINTNYAQAAHLPKTMVRLEESPQSPYTNVLVTRPKHRKNKALLCLAKVLHDPAIVAYAQAHLDAIVVKR